MLRLRAHIKVPAALWPLQKFGAEMAPSLHRGPAHLRLRWLDALRRSHNSIFWVRPGCGLNSAQDDGGRSEALGGNAAKMVL
jgi:hypothetical protein